MGLTNVSMKTNGRKFEWFRALPYMAIVTASTALSEVGLCGISASYDKTFQLVLYILVM